MFSSFFSSQAARPTAPPTHRTRDRDIRLHCIIKEIFSFRRNQAGIMYLCAHPCMKNTIKRTPHTCVKLADGFGQRPTLSMMMSCLPACRALPRRRVCLENQ